MLTYPEKEKYTVEDLEAITTLLRSPEGCPWDREQTHESIRRNMIEEAYEAAGAIDEKDEAHLLEELGDVLLQVVFHADMEKEKGGFTLTDIADGTCRKLLRRHPHVFGAQSASSGEGALEMWEAAKAKERKDEAVSTAMASVAESLPALWRAEKIQKKAEKGGVVPPTAAELATKLRQEAGKLEKGECGIGEVLFAVVAAARNQGTDPEQALHAVCDRYIHEFEEKEGNTL